MVLFSLGKLQFVQLLLYYLFFHPFCCPLESAVRSGRTTRPTLLAASLATTAFFHVLFNSQIMLLFDIVELKPLTASLNKPSVKNKPLLSPTCNTHRMSALFCV
jgi:hypothetical protein